MKIELYNDQWLRNTNNSIGVAFCEISPSTE